MVATPGETWALYCEAVTAILTSDYAHAQDVLDRIEDHANFESLALAMYTHVLVDVLGSRTMETWQKIAMHGAVELSCDG